MTKTLWLDVDGVLLDWVRPFLEFSGRKEKYENLYQYDFSNIFGDSPENMRDWIDQFNENADDYGFLEPLVSQEELCALKRKGYTLNIISQTTSAYSEKWRRHNLALRFGPEMFEDMVFTRHGDNKAKILRTIEPYEVIHVVEDNPKFFCQAAAVGGFKPVAIAHPYNYAELKTMRGFPIYTGMSELVRDLCAG